jgi:hypothetical protein
MDDRRGIDGEGEYDGQVALLAAVKRRRQKNPAVRYFRFQKLGANRVQIWQIRVFETGPVLKLDSGATERDLLFHK